MSNNIYTPPNCYGLDKAESNQQLRLGIQGFPGSGKTWGALTFKNPIVLNLDRGLGAHQGRADVIEIPFYKNEFSGGKTQLKDRLISWLEKEGPKLTREQTLVFDGCTTLDVSYHLWFEANKHNFLTKSGKLDDFAEFQVKKKYFGEIHSIFKSLTCNVIFISHEYERPDKPTTIGQPGEYTGKIRPLLTGAYGDIIVGEYTDWFRQQTATKPADYTTVKPEVLARWGMKSTDEFKAMCDTYPRNTIYFWQTAGDDKFDGKCSSLINYPHFLPANAESFNKYKRKN